MVLEEAVVGFVSPYRVVLSPFVFFLDEVRVERAPGVGFEETFVGEEVLDLFFLETMRGEEEPSVGEKSAIRVLLSPDRFLWSSVVGFDDLYRVEEFQVVVL